MEIRRATEDDLEALWPIFRAVIATGDTYVFAPETSREDAFAYWFGPGVASYVAEEDGRIVGMYKIIPNQRDLGSHVANASFMVDPSYGGRGAGRAMGAALPAGGPQGRHGGPHLHRCNPAGESPHRASRAMSDR